ncbi:MAG TPA: TraR/DksA family transcriptional regulator [Aliiroseovarius sp.]|nr:TraR/DksA family transcriptional regulator [Aliiroseovarius sp.]
MTREAKYRPILQARMAELNARLLEVDRELDSHQSKDWEELATERETDEVLEHEGNMAKEEIAKITAALARMDEGEFGFCVKCGDEISEERLDAVPYTPFCRKCAP